MRDVQGTAARLTELLGPAMRRRIAELGEEKSGADNFYRTRLEGGRVFTDYEIGLLEELMRHDLRVSVVHEIGSGWGQFVFLLAWCGYHVQGFERRRSRAVSAGEFHRLLRGVDRERADRATLRHGSFPPWFGPKTGDALALATNFVTGWNARKEARVIAGLCRYRYVLLDIDRFGIKRTPDERPLLLARFKEAGLADLGVFCDLGAAGHYRLFQPPQR